MMTQNFGFLALFQATKKNISTVLNVLKPTVTRILHTYLFHNKNLQSLSHGGKNGSKNFTALLRFFFMYVIWVKVGFLQQGTTD